MKWEEIAPQLVNALSLGGIYALIAVGYTMVYGILKLINFAHGEIFMSGAFVGVIALSAGWSLIPSIAAACAFCAVLGVTIDRVAYQPLRSAPKLAPLITALGMSIFLQNAAMMVWGSGMRPFPVLSPKYPMTLKKAPENSKALIDEIASRLEKVRDGKYDEAMTGLFLGEYRVAKRNLEEERARDAKSAELVLLEKRLAEARENIPRVTAVTRIPDGLLVEFRNGTGDALKTLSDVRREAQQALKIPRTAVEWNRMEVRKHVLERGFMVGGVEVQWKQPLIWFVTLALMLGLEFMIRKTSVGRAMRAVALDQNTAALMGVSVNNIIRLTFVIGSALAAVGGVLYALKLGGGVVFTMGTQVGVIAFSAAVLGGIGNIRGAALGGLLIGVITNLAIWKLGEWGVGGVYGPAIAFLVLIAVILVRPTGLLGSTSVERA
ncbi:MAG: branched-chain amino acid transport system permease [Planctomycetota bacterium]|nr:MAG: branched-chain amino acid transport system permease [Planctomycetota bacterium]